MEINYTKAARKVLRKMPKNTANQILDAIDALAESPLSAKGVKLLQGTNDLYRLRVGGWRVIYTFENKIMTITVVKIGSRGDVYKNL